MRQSVKDAFVKFTVQFEGRTTFMYTDAKGLVTTGIGNLIDPVGAAMGLPWKTADGSPATPEQIQAEFDMIKNAGAAGRSFAARNIATLHLDDSDVDALVWKKALSNWDYLASRYLNLENWPADAQMAIMSMAWAMGPGFNFPQFASFVNRNPPDFTFGADPTVAHFRGVGIEPRIVANDKLWANAAKVTQQGSDPERLWYPEVTPDGASKSGGFWNWVIGGGIIAGGLAAYYLIPEERRRRKH